MSDELDEPIPDAPPRVISIYVAPGEPLTVTGEDEFMQHEVVGIYRYLLIQAEEGVRMDAATAEGD